MDPLSPHDAWSSAPSSSDPYISAPISNPYAAAPASSSLTASGSAGGAPLPPPPPASASSTHIRDPQVYGSPGAALVSPPPAADKDGATERAGPFLRVRIGGVERNRKDLLVRYDASTNLRNFRTSLYRNNQRSYAEFQRFAEQAQLCCPQTIIPALPLPHTSATTDEEDDRLVRIALQRWFSRVCEDPVLQQSDELRSFIEADFSYQPVPPPLARRPASSTTAVPQVFTAALNKVVRRGAADDEDELTLAKGALEKLEERWGGAAAAVGALGKQRRALAVANTDVGAKLISLATVESEPNLATAERKIGRTYEQLSGMAGAQAANENVVLSDSLGYQALNARAAKEALVQRAQVLEDAQNATKAAISKRRNVERLKGSSNISASKVDDAIDEMKDAVALEEALGDRVRAMSTSLRTSLGTHSANAHEDVAVALLEHARMSIIYHRQTLRELEALRPDVARVGAPVAAATAAAPPPRSAAALSSAAASAAGSPIAHAPYSPYASSSSSLGGGPPSARPGQPHVAQPQAQAPQTPSHQPQPSMNPSRPYQPPPGTATGTSQSMFLPAQTHDAVGRPHSAGPLGAPYGGQPTAPLLPGQAQAQAQAQGQGPYQPHPGMAQSMLLPGQRAQTLGRAQAKRLDERKAAKLLAGGF
ncbi:Vacuolar protein sorting-associated protein 17 [Cryptotrichosporon argae]